MKKLFLAVLAAALVAVSLPAADVSVGGSWEMTMDSPHGKMTGPLTLHQDGAKLTGTFETQMTGKLPIAGTVEGAKITFTLEVPGGQMTLSFEGSRDGDKLTGTTKPMSGEWSAVRK